MSTAPVSILLKASLLPLALLYSALPMSARAWLDVPCLFTAAFGIHCPGCGMKTAIVALLQLDWPGAISLNPLAPAALAALAWVSIRQSMELISNRGSA